MNRDEARQFVGEHRFVGSAALAYSLSGLAEGDALDRRERDESRAELVQLVGAGTVPPEIVTAFDVAARANRKARERDRIAAADAVGKHGVRAAAEAAEASGSPHAVFAVMDASERPIARRSAGATLTRSRESRPRTRRTRKPSSDDDHLADLHRRCLRCGAELRARERRERVCDPCLCACQWAPGRYVWNVPFDTGGDTLQ